MNDNLSQTPTLIRQNQQSFPDLMKPDFEITKGRIEQEANDIVSELMETGDPKKITETVEILTAMDVLRDAIRKDPRFIDLVRDEVSKNGGSITLPTGTKIEAYEAGVTYNYEANADWRYLSRMEKTYADLRKSLEAKLKAIPAGQVLVDTETGVTLEGAVKSSVSTFKTTLAR